MKRMNVDIPLTHRRRWKHSNAIQMRFKFDPRPLSLNFIRPLAYRVVGGRAPHRGGGGVFRPFVTGSAPYQHSVSIFLFVCLFVCKLFSDLTRRWHGILRRIISSGFIEFDYFLNLWINLISFVKKWNFKKMAALHLNKFETRANFSF